MFNQLKIIVMKCLDLRGKIVFYEGENAKGVFLPSVKGVGYNRCYWGNDEQFNRIVKICEKNSIEFTAVSLDTLDTVSDCPAHLRMRDCWLLISKGYLLKKSIKHHKSKMN